MDTRLYVEGKIIKKINTEEQKQRENPFHTLLTVPWPVWMLYGAVWLRNYYTFSWLVLNWAVLSSYQRRLLHRSRISHDSIYYSHATQKNKTKSSINRASPRCKAHAVISAQERGREWWMREKTNKKGWRMREREKKGGKKRASDNS